VLFSLSLSLNTLPPPSLSIANLMFQPTTDEFGCKQYSLTLNMDFQDVSSHMSPDVSTFVGIRSEQVPSLVGILLMPSNRSINWLLKLVTTI
jgi:hypothetical protein